MKFQKTIYRIVLWGLLAFSQVANAQVGGPPPGGTSTPGIDPSTFVRELYLFALAVSGLLAMGMIIMGGVQYIISAGNGSRQSAAKDRILNALLGLLLLIGSYILLNTLNPAIVSLDFPKLDINAVPK